MNYIIIIAVIVFWAGMLVAPYFCLKASARLREEIEKEWKKDG